ncbi:type I restriction-modification enzyme R subunit C-terminal domain-containing protein [Actinomadura latina]|uniref:type I restriction-modification enzyme R subunit C-terminal domain-containing protein n=1 Tax=Actinomadura latina TaxID=163603 RepID=UPI000A7C47BD
MGGTAGHRHDRPAAVPGAGDPLLSRSERARRVAVRHHDFLDSFAPKAREVLDRVLDQYAAREAEELEIRALRSTS